MVAKAHVAQPSKLRSFDPARIADIHHMLPDSGLFIVGEHFLRIEMNLLGLPGTAVADIKAVQSLNVALGQCRKFIQHHQLRRHMKRISRVCRFLRRNNTSPTYQAAQQSDSSPEMHKRPFSTACALDVPPPLIVSSELL